MLNGKWFSENIIQNKQLLSEGITHSRQLLSENITGSRQIFNQTFDKESNYSINNHIIVPNGACLPHSIQIICRYSGWCSGCRKCAWFMVLICHCWDNFILALLSGK